MANYCQEYCQPLAIHPRQDHFLQPSIEEVAESEVVVEKRLAFVKPLPRLDPNGTNWLSDHWKWIVGGVVLAGALVAGCVLAGCLPDATIVAGGGGGAAVAAAASEGGDPISSAAQDFFADAEAVGGAAEVDTGQVAYGSTDLSQAVQEARLEDGNAGNNYAAARLEDGTILTGRSAEGIHAEESVIAQAGDRNIVDMYSEREPCANLCAGLTQGMNVTYSWPWNGVDRGAVNAEIKAAVRLLFGR